MWRLETEAVTPTNQRQRTHLQQLPAGAQVVTFGRVVQHPLDGLDLQLGVLREQQRLEPD